MFEYNENNELVLFVRSESHSSNYSRVQNLSLIPEKLYDLPPLLCVRSLDVNQNCLMPYANSSRLWMCESIHDIMQAGTSYVQIGLKMQSWLLIQNRERELQILHGNTAQYVDKELYNAIRVAQNKLVESMPDAESQLAIMFNDPRQRIICGCEVAVEVPIYAKEKSVQL